MTRAALASTMIAALGACAEDPGVYVDLRPAPDPSVNTPDEVARRVESIVIVLDSPDGLYEPGEEQTRGNVQIENADTDPALELVATVAVRGGALPIVRVRQGGLPAGVALDVRLLGLPSPSGDPIATGGLDAVALEERAVDVPFNLLPSVLPPRVVDVIPDDGDVADGCAVERVVLVFSKPIAPATLLAPGAVTFDPGGAPRATRVDASGRFADLTPPAWSFTGEARYTVTVATSVTDLAGAPLDQVPARDGPQPYVHEFHLPCE